MFTPRHLDTNDQILNIAHNALRSQCAHRLIILGRFPFTKNSGLKFRKLHVLNGTVHSGCTDPTQASARFVIVASQQTQDYTLKEKSLLFVRSESQFVAHFFLVSRH